MTFHAAATRLAAQDLRCSSSTTLWGRRRAAGAGFERPTRAADCVLVRCGTSKLAAVAHRSSRLVLDHDPGRQIGNLFLSGS